MQLLEEYINKFNSDDDEIYQNTITNDRAYEWLKNEIPIIELPDKDIEETYYFRWWTYRKHIKLTDMGYVITEFLPEVRWSKDYNTINAAVGHHLYEGRWLKNASLYLNDYINFFLSAEQTENAHQYSSWFLNAIYEFDRITGSFELNNDKYVKMCKYYEEWEKTHQLTNGMFWSCDNYDAMEYSESGTINGKAVRGIRPTLNSYMCADAAALGFFAHKSGHEEDVSKYNNKAGLLKRQINEKLWKDGFYRAFHPIENNTEETFTKASPRELIGYIPFAFNIAEHWENEIFDLLEDKSVFYSEFGLTTLEKNNKNFLKEFDHECLWNGYVWPFATTQVLNALINFVKKTGEKKYGDMLFRLVKQYALSSHITKEDGKKYNWIDEAINPLTGEWDCRKKLKDSKWPEECGGLERGKDYNHSAFCDIVLRGILGIDERDSAVEVNPNIPEDWDWFKVENLYFRGIKYTVTYDKNGSAYNRGKGIVITCD